MKSKPFAITIVSKCDYVVTLHKKRSLSLTKPEIELLLESLAKEPDFRNAMKNILISNSQNYD